MRTCIDKLIYDKVTTKATNYDNLKDTVCDCPHCHSKNYKKNGFNPKHRLKYRCKDCGAVFMVTTVTFFSHSPAKFLTWVEFMAYELNGQTLEQESLAIEKPVHTCFNMRHKLFSAADRKLKYMIELKKRRSTTSMGLMRQPSSVNAADIWKQKMPIDLYRAYGEYHYGIFSPERLSN